VLTKCDIFSLNCIRNHLEPGPAGGAKALPRPLATVGEGAPGRGEDGKERGKTGGERERGVRRGEKGKKGKKDGTMKGGRETPSQTGKKERW